MENSPPGIQTIPSGAGFGAAVAIRNCRDELGGMFDLPAASEAAAERDDGESRSDAFLDTLVTAVMSIFLNARRI